MQDLVNKILVVINECKDPLNDNAGRNIRDDALDALGKGLHNVTREEFEKYAKNEGELQSLSWFYTRFVHFRTTGAQGKFK